jgi:hypothetical protein
VGLQLLENKVLSRGITRKSACILTEITIRNSQISGSDQGVACQESDGAAFLVSRWRVENSRASAIEMATR